MLLACGPLLLPSGLCRCQPEGGLATPSPKPVAKAYSHGQCHKADPPKQAPPQPKKHKPGCPTELASVDRSPTTDTAVVAVLQFAPVIAPVTTPPVVRSDRHEVLSFVPSTPVYLSHCALVL